MATKPTNPRLPQWQPQLVPGEATPGPWIVSEVPADQACVALAERVALLPGLASREDYLATAHEHAHLAHSWLPTAEPQDTENPLYVLCQEAMIEAISLTRGLDIRAARDHLDWSSMPIPSDPIGVIKTVLNLEYSLPGVNNPQIGRYLAQAYNSLPQEWRPIYWRAQEAVGIIGRVSEGWAKREREGNETEEARLARREAMREAIIEQARDLWREIKKLLDQQPEKPQERTEEQKQAEQEYQQEQEQQAEAQQQAEQREKRLREKLGGEQPKHAPKLSKPDPNKPGESQGEPTRVGGKHWRWYVHHHVTARRPGKHVSAGSRASDSGSRVKAKYLRRYYEGRIFVRSNRGGGILIDVSGSNQGNIEELQALLSKFPNLWIGTHTGYAPTGAAERLNTNYMPSEYDQAGGRLCVIAENGRWGFYDPKEPGNSTGNYGSDLPALQELVKRATAPYIWLSDGKAWCPDNTRHYRVCREYQEACYAMMQRHKILRVATLKDLLAYFAGETIEAHTGLAARMPITGLDLGGRTIRTNIRKRGF